MQPDAKSQAIALMLDTMQHSLPDMKTAMTVYCGVVADVDEGHVKQAVWRFLRGDVPRANHAFCPSPPEFSIEARGIAERERLEARKAELLAKFGDELRERNGGDWDQPYTLPPRIRELAKTLV